MTLFLTLGFLPRELFPPLYRHVDVAGVDLDPVDPAPLLLARYDSGARADERIALSTILAAAQS